MHSIVNDVEWNSYFSTTLVHAAPIDGNDLGKAQTSHSLVHNDDRFSLDLTWDN